MSKIKWFYDDQLLTNNLLNSQNYFLDKRWKSKILIDYFLSRDSLFFPLNIIMELLKFLTIFVLYRFFDNRGTKIFMLIIHIFLMLFLLPVLYFNLYFYLIFYLYLSFVISNAIVDSKISRVTFYGINYSLVKRWYWYVDSLVKRITVWKNILKNNWKIMLNSFIYTIGINLIIIILYFI